MAIKPHYSISAAAKAAGINRDTLRRWLEIDLGIKNKPRGGKVLLTEDFQDGRIVRGVEIRNPFHPA